MFLRGREGGGRRGLEDALALVRSLRPRRTLLVGVSDLFEHHGTNARLRGLLAEGLDVQARPGACSQQSASQGSRPPRSDEVASDGLYVDLDL